MYREFIIILVHFMKTPHSKAASLADVEQPSARRRRYHLAPVVLLVASSLHDLSTAARAVSFL
jgi:hypothetical protein